MREYSSSTYRRPKSIIEWKRTPGQYVAILEQLQQFESTLDPGAEEQGPETILVGRRRDDNEEDWYALAYGETTLEFDEAREMASQALERWRAGETT